MSKFAKLEELCNKVSEHPELPTVLEGGTASVSPWLPMDNICNGHVQTSPEFKQLMDELSLEIHGLFINNRGGCTKEFYEAESRGYKLKVVEADSFGPLGCSFTNKDNKWHVCYG